MSVTTMSFCSFLTGVGSSSASGAGLKTGMPSRMLQASIGADNVQPLSAGLTTAARPPRFRCPPSGSAPSFLPESLGSPSPEILPASFFSSHLLPLAWFSSVLFSCALSLDQHRIRLSRSARLARNSTISTAPSQGAAFLATRAIMRMQVSRIIHLFVHEICSRAAADPTLHRERGARCAKQRGIRILLPHF